MHARLCAAGEGFLPAVIERVREGMELSGEPSVRLKALRMYKGMLRTKEWRCVLS